MGGGGAGHASGATIPTYQEDVHGLLLRGEDKAGDNWITSLATGLGGDYVDNPSLMRFILEKGLTEAGGNPYDGVSAFDPGDDLDDVQTAVADFRDAVAALEPATDWAAYLAQSRLDSATDVAVLDVDGLMESVTAAARRTVGSAMAEALERAAESDRGALVDKALAAFEKRQRKEHFKVVSRFTAPLAEGGAINSSAYVVGVALLESEYEDRLAAFDAEFTLPLTRETFSAFVNAYIQSAQVHLDAINKARLAEKQLKQQYLLESNRMLMSALHNKAQLDHAGVNTITEANRIRIVALGEEQQLNVEYDVKAAGWDMDLFQQAGNVISAINGSVVPGAGKPNRVQSAIGGAFGGGAIGAQTAGPWGALGGGLAGAIGGYFFQ